MAGVRSGRGAGAGFKLDGLKWLKEESGDDADELPEPEELAADAMTELKAVVADLEQVLKLLGQGQGVGA